jgi:hypothetical protein
MWRIPQSLQISWNHLTIAKVENFELEEIAQHVQHASQMTFLYVSTPRNSAETFSMPPIIQGQPLPQDVAD